LSKVQRYHALASFESDRLILVVHYIYRDSVDNLDAYWHVLRSIEQSPYGTYPSAVRVNDTQQRRHMMTDVTIFDDVGVDV
jgi:hypothetical protein